MSLSSTRWELRLAGLHPCKKGHFSTLWKPTGKMTKKGIMGYRCGVCDKLNRIKNKEKIIARSKKWQQDNPERTAEYCRNYQRRKAGVMGEPTRPVPENCECCGKKFNEQRVKYKSPNLDHDHKTGKFRGWLCFNCNVGIGKLGDSEVGLMKALKYLERYRDELDAFRMPLQPNSLIT